VRNTFCWLIMASLPASLLAGDSGAAMLYAKGTAWLNGAPVQHSSAIFPGDVVQTKNDALANISAPGSNVVVLPDSVLKYEGSALSLERGSVTVATSKHMSTHVGEIAVTPTGSSQQTEFEVTDKGDAVQIVARRGDLSMSDGAGTSAVVQGQQIEVQKNKSKKKKGAAAMPTGNGSIMTPKVAAIAGGAAGGGILIWVVSKGGNPSPPVSADTP
jgi:hypothetical protein